MCSNSLRIVTVWTVLLALTPWARGEITIHFDSPTYQVQPLGTVQATISYDADPNTPGDQSLPGGLFREALFLSYPAYGPYIANSFNNVVLPGAMNTPITPGGDLAGGTNLTESIAAQLDPSASTGYTGTLLATITFSNDAHPGTYPVTLALNPSASPSFIDFPTHSSQDSAITFQGATITVLPEPAAVLLAPLAILSLFRRRHLTVNNRRLAD